jgi:hypothetical protein
LFNCSVPSFFTASCSTSFFGTFVIDWSGHFLVSLQGDQTSLWKNRPKCSPTHIFCQNWYLTFSVLKTVTNFLGSFCYCKKTAHR